jgi:hypothetical protein
MNCQTSIPATSIATSASSLGNLKVCDFMAMDLLLKNELTFVCQLER